MKKMITSFFILICWLEALVDVLSDVLRMKSKHKLETCDVEAVLSSFYLECPNLLGENFFRVTFNSEFEIQLQCVIHRKCVGWGRHSVASMKLTAI